LAGNLVKPLLSLYGTEWRERGYGLSSTSLGDGMGWNEEKFVEKMKLWTLVPDSEFDD
jgi:hypothetical protein